MTADLQPPAQVLNCAGRSVDLSRPHVMGILNVTPDSFSDGGRFLHLDSSLRHVAEMVAAGASFIDVGGESTRPGAGAVSISEELDRVIPVIDAIVREFDVVVSIDTSKAEIIRAAATAGAGLINDVRALREAGALEAAADTALPLCLMHMQGQPADMQNSPNYYNVVADVLAFLEKRIAACETAGIDRSRIVIDPGFGFGKTAEHNLQLLNRLSEFVQTGFPILVGLSRKSLLGKITGRDVEQRLAGGVAAAALAVTKGARIIRAHDVPATIDAVKVAQAMIRESVDE